MSRPLATLLSQTLVAWTFEFDNEFERRFAAACPGRYFRVSLVMWSNYLRFVPEGGVTLAELAEAAGVPRPHIASTTGGMERWGYVAIDREPTDCGPAPRRDGFGSARRLRADSRIVLAKAGRTARELWMPLLPEIEARWNTRFGARPMRQLRDALRALDAALGLRLPDYVTIAGAGGMFVDLTTVERSSSPESSELPALLSRVLLAFTLEFEKRSKVSLMLAANVVRVLDDRGVLLRELPHRSGVSKEAIHASLTWLASRGLVEVERGGAAKGAPVVRLTPVGVAARAAYDRDVAAVETAWIERFGADRINAIRRSLEELFEPTGAPRIAAGLTPPPDGWRAHAPYARGTEAMIAAPATNLPHHPMVLHRGGWPDGS